MAGEAVIGAVSLVEGSAVIGAVSLVEDSAVTATLSNTHRKLLETIASNTINPNTNTTPSIEIEYYLHNEAVWHGCVPPPRSDTYGRDGWFYENYLEDDKEKPVKNQRCIFNIYDRKDIQNLAPLGLNPHKIDNVYFEFTNLYTSVDGGVGTTDGNFPHIVIENIFKDRYYFSIPLFWQEKYCKNGRFIAYTNKIPHGKENIASVNLECLYTDTGAENAGSFATNVKYTITLPGTTEFTLIGSNDNVAGTVFRATGPGSGTGQAKALSAPDPLSADGVFETPINKIWIGSFSFDSNIKGMESVDYTHLTAGKVQFIVHDAGIGQLDFDDQFSLPEAYLKVIKFKNIISNLITNRQELILYNESFDGGFGYNKERLSLPIQTYGRKSCVILISCTPRPATDMSGVTSIHVFLSYSLDDITYYTDSLPIILQKFETVEYTGVKRLHNAGFQFIKIYIRESMTFDNVKIAYSVFD